jgi:hypothetical protein
MREEKKKRFGKAGILGTCIDITKNIFCWGAPYTGMDPGLLDDTLEIYWFDWPWEAGTPRCATYGMTYG